MEKETYSGVLFENRQLIVTARKDLSIRNKVAAVAKEQVLLVLKKRK